MISITTIAKNIQEVECFFRFSICTIVSDKDQYQTMLDSFIQAGFSTEKCEYLYIDNIGGNKYDAFGAFNIFLQQARGKYIIICHQDIELKYDTIQELEQKIAQVNQIDHTWALLGNAGAINLKYKTVCVTHGTPPFHDKRGKHFPQKVQTLDENFILIKRKANLSVSSDLKGFHLYGTDICIIAKILGYNSYVIDFHLYHKSRGNIDESFMNVKKALLKKYEVALKGRFIQSVTVAKFYISGSKFINILYNTSIARTIARQYLKLKLLLTGKY